MNIRMITVGVWIMLTLATTGFGKEWRGIVPLHSTCEDVKRILGVAKCEYPTSTYYLPNEIVEIDFKQYPCNEKWPYETWNVPIGTVKSIKLRSKTPVHLTDYFEKGKFTKVETDVGGLAWYSNGEGIRVEAFNEEVLTVIYGPTAKDESLRCTTFDASWRNRGTVRLPSLFKIYTDIPLYKEKEFLNDYARNLREYGSDSQGYIVVYAGRRARIGEARTRATRAKDYLVNVRRIEADRIGIIDGGYHEKLTVELHIGPHGMPPPMINPTVHPSEVQIINAGKLKGHRYSPQLLRRQKLN
jgi:hypothetical protein